LQHAFEIVGQLVELLDGVVTNFQKSILPSVGSSEIGREEFFKNFLCLVLIGLPFVMSVDVEVEQAQTISARSVVADLPFLDVPVNVAFGVDVPYDIKIGIEFAS